jgi:hypothetical protein
VSLLRGAVIGLVAWLAGAGQADALNLTNNRPIVQETLAPGDAVQGSIDLANNGPEPMHVKVYAQDWRYTPSGDGEKEFASPQSLPRSASGWLSVFPASLELPPRGRGSVDYVIRVPNDAALDGGYYAVLFFESALGQEAVERTEGPSAKVQLAARLGSLFLVDVKGTVKRQAQLSSLALTPPGPATPLVIRAEFSNDGNTALRCEGFFHLLAGDGLITGRGELPARYVWPGDRVPVLAEWAGSLSAGSHTAVLTYDCGGELVVTEEAELVAP